MQPRRDQVHQPLHQRRDLWHVGHQVIVIQHQHHLVLQLPGQRIQKRVQGFRGDVASPLLQGPKDGPGPGRRQGLKGRHQVGQKEQGIAVGLCDGVPAQDGDQIRQGRQRRALAVAGGGLHDGQRIVQHGLQARLEAGPAQEAPALPGRKQLAANHQFVQSHHPAL